MEDIASVWRFTSSSPPSQETALGSQNGVCHAWRPAVDRRSRQRSESSSDSEASGAYGSDGGHYGVDFGAADSDCERGSADLPEVPLAQPSNLAFERDNDDDGSAAAGDDQSTEPKKRRRFGPFQDYMLAVQVNVDEPFKARHGEVGKQWDALAAKLNSSKNFNMHAIKGTTAKNRFETLLEKHEVWESQSARKSGTNEEEDDYIVLMTELKTKVSDHEAATEEEKEKRARKEHEKVASGEVVREAAVSRLGKRTAVASGNEAAPSSNKRKQKQDAAIAGIFTEINKHRADIMSTFVQVQNSLAEKAAADRAKELEKKLQIETERTKRRQLDLEFEREQRQKDREEQTKLLALLLKRNLE